jgi:pimeloyl-ACP methyl ester carboxylesterase
MRIPSCVVALLLLAAPASRAESLLRGDLSRKGDLPLEEIQGLDSLYDVLSTGDGVRLRTILTRPTGHRGRLPAILFVQWLSCDSIELPTSADDGWSRMLRRVAKESGLVMMRTEKRGVGDSEGGPCSALDYRTELSDHRAALGALKSSELVDPEKVVIFGASMGGTYAPLVALDQDVAGIVVWGAGARNWFERMLAFERRYRELSDTPAGVLNAEMKDVAAFLFEYLVRKKSPQQIGALDPRLGRVWQKLVGAEGDSHYGRPVAFHQQAEAQNWTEAWNRLRSRVLVLYGEYDWYEEAASASLIARVVNRNRPGGARFVVIPSTDHHFNAFSSAEEAVKGQNGRVNEEPLVREILSWLREASDTAMPN